ncbi:hypothetical protein N8742_02915 [Emcibacteraceae bacterium]|nr:hypothetical protein [Emcibacteraceae bacterium]
MTSPLKINTNGEKVGKHPEEISTSEFETLGHQKEPTLKIIRKYCMDCCCHQSSEVSKCVSDDCPLWPYRMGTNPFRTIKSVSENQLIALQEGRRQHE